MPLILIDLPESPKIKPTWREKTMILRHDSGRIEALDGMAYGRLGVHPTSDTEPRIMFALSHIPTMMVVMRLDNPEDCVSAAEYIYERCGLAFDACGEPVNKSMVPSDVVDWIRRCNASAKLEPIP